MAASLPPEDRRVADSLPKTWVDRADPRVRPYLRLARYDRPAGFWLLAIPCWMGLALAGAQTGYGWSDLGLAALFGIGAVAMRGAGCTYNDIVDRDLDAKVARTADRPLAAGTVSVKQAWSFLIAQCLVGLIVLLMLPLAAILTGLGSLALVAAYPFMKRVTWWPQAWLGLTFNWGVPTAYVAATGRFDLPAGLLYLSAIFWTLGYDTIYACQDKQDDALVGVKSSARALGSLTKPGVAVFYLFAGLLALTAGLAAAAPPIFLAGFAAYAAHLAWLAARFDPEDGALCLTLFKSSRETGLLLVLAYSLAAFV